MTAKNNHPELVAQLTEGISTLTSSEEWQRYLELQSRFHHYSFGNVLLIAAQCHKATRVAGFNAWRKLNRFVRKGEKAIWVLAPMIYKNADDCETDRVVRGVAALPRDSEPLSPLQLWERSPHRRPAPQGNPGGRLQRLEEAQPLRPQGRKGHLDSRPHDLQER